MIHTPAAVVRLPTLRMPAVAVVATAGIVAQADLRLALHAPGWRGVLWLGLLVGVAHVAPRPGTTTAVALLASASALLLGLVPQGPLGVVPYLAAAAALEGIAVLAVVRRHPVLLAVAAAPIHLVALVVPLGRSLAVGVTPAVALAGIGGVVLLHLVFGLVAGLLALTSTRPVRRQDTRTTRSSTRSET
ncbi:hypothetical protein [Actinomycetospora chiangmaiensis]|uniref:hypothetical protein n=1 Tax=Actinomycetospora chiangmaiensis TaxID=402650 RepID=UPI0003817F59|nr:hypothetical protein [Actinomycetospora chiangmaiensis]